MATFFMFGKYNPEALDHVSSERSREAELLVARFQGTIKDMYVLLGDQDLVIILELPGLDEALKVSTGLTKLTGVSFKTYPAFPAKDFDIFVQVAE